MIKPDLRMFSKDTPRPDLPEHSFLPAFSGPRPAGRRSLWPRAASPLFFRLKRGLFSSFSTALDGRRLFIIMPFAMIAGILIYRVPRFEPPLAALGAVGLLLLASMWIWRRAYAVLLVLFVVTIMWTGVVLLPIHGALFGTEMVYGAIYGTFQADVEQIYSDDGQDARIIVSNFTPTGTSRAPPMRKARIVVPSSLRPQMGARIEARMRFYKVPGPIVPGGFDSQFHAYFSGIGAFGSLLGDMHTVRAPRGGPLRSLQNLRDQIGRRIDLALSQPASGIARALIIGDQSRVNSQVRKNLASAGLAHVLAISGLHLSLVAGGMFALVRMLLAASFTLSRIVNARKVAAVAGIITALSYLGLSGASVSATRATIMLLLVFGAVLAGRRALTMRNVAIAALCIIVFSPASIFRPGFQLSFAAVISLVGVYEGYRPIVKNKSNLLAGLFSSLGGIMLTSLIAGAATALFAAYHFQQVAPFGVIGNIVAIPLVALIVLPSAVFSVFFMPFGIEGPFLSAMGWGIERIIEASNIIASMGTGLISAPLLGPVSLLLAFSGLAGFAFFTSRLRYLIIIVVALLVPLVGTQPRPDILVADSTKAIAMRLDDALSLVTGRTNSFAVRAWAANYLEPVTAYQGDMNCDALGCVYVTSDFVVALPHVPAALEEDCHAAQLVIARFDVSDFCRIHAQVIDRKDLQYGGVHWANWNGKSFTVRTAITDSLRPWRPDYPF